MSIKVKPILPIKFKVSAITDALEDLVRETVDEIDKDYAKTVKTWKTKPDFDKSVKRTKSSITGEVSTTNKIYKYLDRGTRVRFAVMSQNFRPKTRSNVIDSFQGRGGFSHFGVKPGIEARNWTVVLARKYQKRISKRASVFLAKGAKNSGHAIL